MRALFVLASVIAVLSAAPAAAQEPVGCDKFSLPVEQEMAALRAPNLKVVASGSNVAETPFAAMLLLAPIKAAQLPKAPERAPNEDTFAGYLSVAAVAPGTYSISLSDAAWVDVLQNNRFLKARAHSGARGCPGIRKVLRFDLTSKSFVVQFSGATTGRLGVAIMPAK